MTVPFAIRSQCDAAAAEYERRLRDIIRNGPPEVTNNIGAVVSGDVDRLFELHEVAVRIAALHVKHGA